jgi:probable HAF family extracellular repeat protein
MSRRALTWTLAGSLMLLLLAPASIAEPWFQSMGLLHEYPTYAIEGASMGLSPDGSVAVGRDIAYSPYGTEATRWTLSGGLVGLGDLIPRPYNSAAYDVSNDGVIVGTAAFSSDTQQAFRWTESGGMVGLGVLSGMTRGQGRAVSYDGSIVVGDCGPSTNYDAGAVPFRWTQATGMTSLGLPTGASAARAAETSADGSVIVGDFTLTTGGVGAWRWTEADGFTNLGNLSFVQFTRAQGISGNGQVIIGNGFGASGFEAFRWTAEGGLVGLGDLPGGSYSSWANGGVSYDGSIIVGGSQSSEYASDAFIWDEVHGMRSLKNVLQNECGLDLAGWNLEEAQGLSDDGLTISGWGYNPDGVRVGWVAHIPEPASLGLLLVGFGLALRRR